jgi:UDPglucose--hexose-1-phosphate uridylyltransferase
MPEVRVDPLTGLRTIIAADRADRPHAWPAPLPAAVGDDDPFAPGREEQTPPELEAVRGSDGAWQARAVPNRWPALSDDSPAPEPSHDADLFTALPATGAHEVIVNSPAPVTSLGDLDDDALATTMELWRSRMRAHADRAACLHLAVNERPEGGASQHHTHAQLFALDFVPALIARERERFTAHATRTMGGNLLQDLVQEEVRQRVRLVAIDDEAVLLSPFAAERPYQLLLAPRRPRARFEDDGPLGAALLADALGRLRRRFGAMPPLNLWVRTAPRGAEHFCWRIDLLPRLTPHGALELGTGLGLNPVAPEQVAAELRDA